MLKNFYAPSGRDSPKFVLTAAAEFCGEPVLVPTDPANKFTYPVQQSWGPFVKRSQYLALFANALIFKFRSNKRRNLHPAPGSRSPMEAFIRWTAK
jgi:hypothetical protein